METFGEKLKQLRQEQNLTQKTLAEKLSVSIPTLSHWECDYQEPSFKDLRNIALFFQVSIDYLLNVDNNIDTFLYKIPQIETNNLKPEENQILNDFKSLPKPEQAQAQSYIHFLAKEFEKTKKKYSR